MALVFFYPCINSWHERERLSRSQVKRVVILLHYKVTTIITIDSKGKADPLQAWSGLEGSRKLRFPHFMTTAQEGGKVVIPTHRPHFAQRKFSWYSFLLQTESTPGP